MTLVVLLQGSKKGRSEGTEFAVESTPSNMQSGLNSNAMLHLARICTLNNNCHSILRRKSEKHNGTPRLPYRTSYNKEPNSDSIKCAEQAQSQNPPRPLATERVEG
eukprot:gnl/MRDRNA2_/MRDRNA2_256740_c0_seq1.p1 gnl/MRDRNA2_/MRDRNA2_256740_c0~~gnl/MRDRNA2_/MRDRNA2_256740_c0_seq1.p1  ORF type:complete len:106 (-),score=18.78 gnl/MRDRNA2_/MRDRNA2_256740_c0_seq1:65-382(-)